MGVGENRWKRDLESGRRGNPLELVGDMPQRWPRGLGALERLESGESKRQTGKEIMSLGKSREWERRRG